MKSKFKEILSSATNVVQNYAFVLLIALLAAISFTILVDNNSLTEESKNIFNVFTETVNKLSTINSKIENASENRKVKANELISEAEQLDAQKVKTKNLSKKINSFLND